jgi:Zn-dependent peptidase ImmA (M78 family)
MPAADIRGSLSGRLILARLVNLKRVWRVAMQALLFRAEEIDAISAHQSRYLWQQISVNNMRRREPPRLDFPREEPRLFPKILQVHLAEYNYTVGELAKAVHMKEAEFRRIYNLIDPDESTKIRHLTVVP